MVKHGLAALEGYARAGLATCVKHFPGHGSTRLDSHLALPVLDATREVIESRDLPPFRAAIEGGVPAIMTGHLACPALDPGGSPATLSAPIVKATMVIGIRRPMPDSWNSSVFFDAV